MGWSGGTFTRVHDWTEDEAGGYDILSSRMDEEDDNFETGINNCLTKDGTNTPTDNLPMGGKKHTGVANGADRTDYAAVGQVQDGSFKYGSVGGSLNDYRLTVTPTPAGYSAGQQFNFKAPRTNSGNTRLNVNSLGWKYVYSEGKLCTGGEIVINCVYIVIYDGTQFHLISGAGGGGVSYGGAKVCLSSEVEVAESTETMIPFSTAEIYDDSNYYRPTSGPKFFIPVTGRYRVTCRAHWKNQTSMTSDAVAVLLMFVNGIVYHSAISLTFLGSAYYYINPEVQLVWEGKFTAGDQILLKVAHYNPEGKSRNLYGDSTEANSTWMAIERIL